MRWPGWRKFSRTQVGWGGRVISRAVLRRSLCAIAALALTLTAAPARPAAAKAGRHVAGFVVFWDGGSSQRTWRKDYASYGQVYFDTATLVEPDRVVNRIPAWVVGFVRRHHLTSQICVANDPGSNFDAAMLHTLLTHPGDQRRVIAQLVHLVAGTPFDGIDMDFENGGPGDAQSFVAFLGQLHAALLAAHKTLSVTVPAETYRDAQKPWNRGYDYGPIARNVDAVLVMAYDYSYQGGPPGPIAPLGWVKHVLQYATVTIPRAKLQLGLPAYAYDWLTKSPYPSVSLTLRQVVRWLRRHGAVQPRWDTAASQPYYTYRDNSGRRHYVAFEDAKSTAAVLRLAKAYRVGTVFTWYVGSETTAVFQELRRYGG